MRVRLFSLLSTLSALTCAQCAEPAQNTTAQNTTTMPRTQPVLGAVGIAVSNLNVSMDFYTKVLPFVDTGVSYDLPQFLEKVVALPAPNSGSSVVLMQWKTPRNTTNIPVKLALYVEDVHESMEKVRAYGNEILLEAGSGRIGTVSLPTGMARDPDGYILEFNPLSILSPKQAL